MSTLVRTWNQARTLEADKTVWAFGAVLMAGAAINVLPIASGAVAYYAATKAESKFLRVLSVAGCIAGILLGVIAAI
ncbi:MAG: hypothetical protein WC838_04035 [Candidatus Margulisiibacteriota bacterium]|jgi:phage-related minor tail protein